MEIKSCPVKKSFRTKVRDCLISPLYYRKRKLFCQGSGVGEGGKVDTIRFGMTRGMLFGASHGVQAGAREGEMKGWTTGSV